MLSCHLEKVSWREEHASYHSSSARGSNAKFQETWHWLIFQEPQCCIVSRNLRSSVLSIMLSWRNGHRWGYWKQGPKSLTFPVMCVTSDHFQNTVVDGLYPTETPTELMVSMRVKTDLVLRVCYIHFGLVEGQFHWLYFEYHSWRLMASIQNISISSLKNTYTSILKSFRIPLHFSHSHVKIVGGSQP